MSEPIWQSVGIPILTAVIAGPVGYYFAIRQTKLDQRISFKKQMAVLIAELQDTEDDGVAHYASSRGTVLSECARIEADIPRRKRSDFKSARIAYCDFEKQEYAAGVQSLMSKVVPGHPDYPPPPKEPKSRKQKMIDALQALANCAK